IKRRYFSTFSSARHWLNNSRSTEGHHSPEEEQARNAQILTDIKGRFQSLDISCDPRDAVDAHLLHSTAFYLLHTLAHYVSQWEAENIIYALSKLLVPDYSGSTF
uniref:Uncharacterized protein n=1 Tax=Coturnix japonica TaxID=93934 RepID=A0A8C2TJE9_COTJA